VSASNKLRVAVLAPMWNELAPLRGPLALRPKDGERQVLLGAIGRVEVVALQAGIGPPAATRAAERALALGGIEHVVVVGIAGAVAPELPLGALVVPARVLDLSSGAAFQPTPIGDEKARGTLATSEKLITEHDAFARMRAEGVVAIDMETAAVAAVCERRGVPWSVFRALSDRAGDPQVGPEVLALAGEDGAPNLPAVIRFVLTRPWRIPTLMRLGRDSSRAARTAAGAAVRALQTL
jgi:nucleoside phosphorylase